MPKYLIERSLLVNAPVERIWDALCDVPAWPEWKPFIRAVTGPARDLALGVRFTMRIAIKGPAVPVPVTVCAFERLRRMAWTGGIPGCVMSVHSFLFEPRGGQTLVISREEFSGALVWAMRLIVSQADLFSLHDRWLQAIKERVEKEGSVPEARTIP